MDPAPADSADDPTGSGSDESGSWGNRWHASGWVDHDDPPGAPSRHKNRPKRKAGSKRRGAIRQTRPRTATVPFRGLQSSASAVLGSATGASAFSMCQVSEPVTNFLAWGMLLTFIIMVMYAVHRMRASPPLTQPAKVRDDDQPEHKGRMIYKGVKDNTMPVMIYMTTTTARNRCFHATEKCLRSRGALSVCTATACKLCVPVDHGMVCGGCLSRMNTLRRSSKQTASVLSTAEAEFNAEAHAHLFTDASWRPSLD